MIARIRREWLRESLKICDFLTLISAAKRATTGSKCVMSNGFWISVCWNVKGALEKDESRADRHRKS